MDDFERNERMQSEKASNGHMNVFREDNQPDQRNGILRLGPAIPGHSIQHDEDQHTWIIDQVLLPCSAAEYYCLKLLLTHANACVSFGSFLGNQEIFPNPSADTKQERLRVAYIMSRLRARLWVLGLDIANVWNIGYILLSESPERASPDEERVINNGHSI